MIVDAQIHVWVADCPERRWPRSGKQGSPPQPQRDRPLGPDEVIAAMDGAGVDRAVLVPPSWEGDRNDVALQAVRDYPDRFAVMGRIPSNIALEQVATWRQAPSMLGARLILRDGDPRVDQGADHPFWATAAAAQLPLMIAPAGKMPLLAQIAERYRTLPIIVDHMAARVHHKGAAAFAQIDALLGLANLDNVAVKATCLPDYSQQQEPWDDVAPYVHALFRRFGGQRLFWGSDFSRLPCSYPILVQTFFGGFPWLTGQERDLVMGDGIRAWLDWP